MALYEIAVGRNQLEINFNEKVHICVDSIVEDSIHQCSVQKG